MKMKLKPTIIYGPVKSRRLGYSLGVNVLPVGAKVCTLDCLYCQLGLRQSMTPSEARKSKFPSVSEVLEAVEAAIRAFEHPLNHITFSGNGEPTLHPRFTEIVEGVNRIRDEWAPGAKTAVLSSATTVKYERVRKGLEMLDERIMKLDAGEADVFERYNRPARSISLDRVTDDLAALDGVTIQALFTKGPDGNYDYAREHLEPWIQRLKKIEPEFVQLYTLARESPTKSLVPLLEEEMVSIQALLEKERIPSEVFT